jgi:hypothetical protein
VAIGTHCEADLPDVVADSTRVRQILNNLIENAFKFTEAGGRIDVRVSRDADDAGAVRVSVEDTGCGIPTAETEEIFGRLHQVSADDAVKRAGLGLGLSICKELVERQQGSIWVESDLGRGSRFHFTLPAWSIADLVRPALVSDGRLREQFGVMRIQIEQAGPGRSDTDATALQRGVRERLRCMVRKETDVLLPPSRGDTLMLVSGVDGPGLRTLSERVRGSLGRDDLLRGCTISVDTRVEPLSTDDLETSESQVLAVAARQIEQLMDDSAAWAA